MKIDLSWQTSITTIATVTTDAGTRYRVHRTHSTWRCDCPIEKTCPHILATEAEIAGR